MDEEPRFGWYAHPPPGATRGRDPAPSHRRSVEQARQDPFPIRMYTVVFHFTFAGDRSDLRKIAEHDLVPGWRVSRWD